MKLALAAALALSTLAGLRPAAADTPPPLTRVSGEREVVYGGATLTFDANAAGFAIAGLVSVNRERQQEILVAVATVLFVAGPPTVHLFHREPGKALGSLGLRIGLPVIGALVGERLRPSDVECESYKSDGVGCPRRLSTGPLVGAGIGAAAAIALDALLLARTRVSEPRTITPQVAASGLAFSFGVAGAF